MTSASVNVKKSSPLHEILKWSMSRPEWQRDALRRIIEKGGLEITDIEELERISRSKIRNAAIKPVPIAAQPLTAGHLPSAPGASDSVALLSLDNLKNVNRLPDGSSLPIGSGKGLTIIYGGNGAGKSSYARVIKKACRARGVCQNITPNAYASKPSSTPASAAITFQIGNTSFQCAWTNGTPADARLGSVFVFDAACADHYVGTDSEASFTPYGLDILPKLSKACDDLAARLNIDIGSWTTKIETVRSNWKYDPTTKVGDLLQTLSKATKDSDVSALATLNNIELQRLATLRDALKADPVQKAKQTRAAKARVETFLQSVKAASTSLSDVVVQETEKQLTHSIESATAAKAFAAGQFDTSFLKGTGSDLWRKLWEAARDYSTAEAYADQEFPSTSPDARCLLCQQELDSPTRERFARFDAFCKDKSQQISEEAERTLSTTTSKYRLITDLNPDFQKVQVDISILTPNQIAQITEFVTKSDERLHQLQQNLESRQWNPTASLPTSPDSILQDAVATLGEKATTEEAANDPVARKALESELRELEGREWLSGVKDDVLKQIERHKIVAEFEGCRKDLSTSAITTESTRLTKTFVTQAYKQRFQEETKKLGLTTLDVAMEATQGKKGVTQFGLRLVNAPKGKVADIASEGEHRCVALAAFLAELSLASHQSALVFDDPVSSLDQWHREKIAERLVEEVKTRQVIVFTHEVIFLNDLLSYANDASQTPYILTVEWCNKAPGKHTQGLPWDRQKPLGCLDILDKDQLAIAAQWNPQPNEANVASMRAAYTRLRSVMERTVETELLGGVVERFQSQVKSGRVKYLAGVTQHECDETKRLLQKCHDLTPAHAPSWKTIPTPADLKKDLDDARKLIDTIRARKNKIK